MSQCGPSPACNYTEFICANSDVLGKGIRINFYYTMVLLAIVPRMPHTEELLNALYSNAGISGLGLLVTAIQQTASKHLSLFHAIFIQHILFFLGTGAAPVGKYHWSKSRLVMGVVFQFASVIAFTGWALYMWTHVKTFGEQNLCNDEVIYVLMFFNVGATKPWLRGIWIATLVLSAAGLVIKFGYDAFTLFVLRHDEGEETEQPEKRWYFFISIPRILSAIYSAVMLELMVHRNNSNHHGGKVIVDDSWAFGQTLSVVMIFANMNEVIHFLFGYIARRRERSRELQAEAQQASDDTDVPPASAPYRPRGPPGSHLSTRDSAQMKLSSEYELSNLNKDNSHVSVNTVGEILQTRDQPVGTLR
ncbi:hypothetical protein EDB85DRAFT_1918063 [Lactarius pseudohatsudake]|nr:hypothetical protein EDB85DRAFT_1918063 [Lactarius pseudohatsudake]